MGEWLFRGFAAFTTVVLAAVLWTVPAAGAPGDGGQVADALTISLDELGTEPALALYGDHGVLSVTIPVSRGLTPEALDAVVEMPVNVGSGTLIASQDDRILSRVPLPPDGGPVAVPLTGARIVDNAVTMTLRSYLLPVEGYCLDPSNPLRLVATTARYAGTEAAPDTVADFLPPILRQLSVYLPAAPSHTEAEAAMRFTTAVVAHYGKQYPDVTVAELADGQSAPPVPSAPLERHVVIREGPQAEVALLGDVGVPALLITGPADQLTNQARLLSSDVGSLAVASKAVVGPLHSSPVLPADVTTLRALGQPGVNATALSPQVAIGLDQTQLGRSVRNVRVHLRGSHTPLPSSVGGQVVVSIGGETIDRWPVDGSGAIDRWVEIPDRLLQRYTNLGVEVDVAGNTGRCGEFQPITLTIDGDSPIETTAAGPAHPGGFQAVPQALMPRVQVGVGDGFDDIRRGVAVMVALQRLSALPIDTAVTSLTDAIASPNPAVLVSGGGWDDSRITLPVNANAAGELTIENADGAGEPTTLKLDPTKPVGSLQTVVDGNRTVLVATSSNGAEQLDSLLGWVNADPDRWSRVNGSALVAVPDREPVVVATRDGQPSPAETVDDRVEWSLVAGVAAIALVVVGAAVIFLRSRRSRSMP